MGLEQAFKIYSVYVLKQDQNNIQSGWNLKFLLVKRNKSNTGCFQALHQTTIITSVQFS